MRGIKKLTSLFVLLLVCLTIKASDSLTYTITLPQTVMAGTNCTIDIETNPAYNGVQTATINQQQVEITFANGKAQLLQTFAQSANCTVTIGPQTQTGYVQAIPLWLSVIPPLLAIGMALIFKEVISSLFLGVLSGAYIIYLYKDGALGLFTGFISVVNKYILPVLLDEGHMSIIVFSMLIGGMVTIISRNGGMFGFVNILAKYARTAKSGQLVTWALGIIIFFDDYANTLVVGNAMRPLTDRLKISREKLAYIVDSTAAPVVSIAFVTTWIGAQLSYVQSGIDSLPDLNENSYNVFLSSLQYAFYPILTIIFMLVLILRGRDFGPMHKFETHARQRDTEEYLETTHSAEEDELQSLTPDEQTPKRAFNGVIPILVLIIGTIAGLYYTGKDAVNWDDATLGFFRKVSMVIGAANSYLALLWASMCSLAVAVLLTLSQRLLTLEKTMSAMLKGFKFMLNAFMILVLAWSLAELTAELHTANFITNNLINLHVPPFVIPAITFIIAGAVAFSTGSSWSTMAIVYPIMLPATWLLCKETNMDYDASLSIFHNVVSCVLAGAILGDHCSPISDTTILSSLASSCNHINHVKTQMPYALTVAAISLIVGTLPAAFGIPFYITLPVSVVIIWIIVSFIGKKVEEPKYLVND
jgi:Na+/H+ antiporter NhaC